MGHSWHAMDATACPESRIFSRVSPLTAGEGDFKIHTPIDSVPERINLRRTAKETAG